MSTKGIMTSSGLVKFGGGGADIATVSTPGIVKPDGTTVTVDADGTIHGSSQITLDNALSTTSINPVQNNVITTGINNRLVTSAATDAYDATKTYAVNEYCIYEDVLYKCITSCINITPSDSAAEWEATSIGEELSSLNSNTTSDFTGATETESGVHGLVPAPASGETDKFLCSDGTWKKGTGGTSIVSVPVADTSVTYTYDGTEQTFQFSSLDSDYVQVTNNKQVNAGTYTVTASLKNSTDLWIDTLTREDREYTWTIGKGQGTISVSPSTITFDDDTLTATLTPTTWGDGTVSYSGYDTDIITISGNIVTATGSSGSTTITATISETTNCYGASTTVSISTSFTPSLEIVDFNDSDLTKVKAMLDAHYAGEINIYDYWAVGDSRTVTISAMSATGVGESHAQQTATIVLTHAGGKTLADGSTTCAFQWDLKNCLTEEGYMNSSKTNSGGWKNSARRKWCNNVFYPALPEGFRNCMKQFINQSGTGGGSSSGVENTTDWTALRAEIEVFGSTSYSVSGEGSQLTYYATSANRVKKLGDSGSACGWWERSPRSGYSYDFCRVNYSGNATSHNAGITFGIAPCGCI